MISEKIVVVDDDPRIHQSLKAVLFEHQLISFLDRQKALEFLLQPNEVRLVLVDVCMRASPDGCSPTHEHHAGTVIQLFGGPGPRTFR